MQESRQHFILNIVVINDINFGFFMTKKIGLIGSKNVGKTTIAHCLTGYLSSQKKSVGLINELALSSPTPLNIYTNFNSACWLFGMQIASEAAAQEHRQFVVCDRTVLDIPPILKVALNFRNELTAEVAIDLNYLVRMIEEYLNYAPYEYLFYIPIDERYWNSNLSEEERNFRYEIDDEFRKFLEVNQINYVEVVSTKSKDRFQEILEVIGG